MSKQSITFAIAVLMALGACKPQAQIVAVEDRNLPAVEVTSDRADTNTPLQLPPYNPSYTRRNDLLHTKLDVRFDWDKQHVIGKATLRLKPVFYATDSLELDAKGFDVKKVVLVSKDGKETPLTYSYPDNMQLRIKLDKSYTRTEEYTVHIEYIAKPNELPVGGSAAITSDKGLYFINPLGKEIRKPKQIWTQGETESNSKWYPTIDRPNERCTQEINITVEDKYTTLSNGLLKSSTKNADGTRTDYWVMDMPHAPYLFMMAIGEFATVKDNWNGMLLEYMVEPEYAAHAKDIFPYTGEMLTFFSTRFGVKYPWQKYSQVVVRDYVSGAMENTTAVIFGEFVQLTKREIMDNPEMNEGIVAHEMMHHWFGDLVTCESWSNLPLNESFANYSEYLWLEHKHGKDAADHHRMNEITGYMAQSKMQDNNHPMIFFNYDSREDMFDAHSYNKGGAILHMLRNYLGDDAYFEGLRTYLEDNKFRAAEIHDLRLAFEKVTGEDLNWFFNQWFFAPRHPELRITRTYNAAQKQIEVKVEQTQDIDLSTIYTLPFYIDIYNNINAKAERHKVVLNQTSQTFTFPAATEPTWVAVDADRILLCERKEEQTPTQWIAQYKLGKTFLDRYLAINELKELQAQNSEARNVIASALNDPFWAIRQSAIDGLEKLDGDAANIGTIKKLATTDPRPNVRIAALERLGDVKDANANDIFIKTIESDQSYGAIAAALDALAKNNLPKALEYAPQLEKESKSSILTGVARVYIKAKDKKYCSFFEQNWSKTKGYSTYTFLDNYVNLLIELKDKELVSNKLQFFSDIAMSANGNSADEWGRYGAANAVKKIRDHYRQDANGNDVMNKASGLLDAIKAKETNAMLQNIYAKW